MTRSTSSLSSPRPTLSPQRSASYLRNRSVSGGGVCVGGGGVVRVYVGRIVCLSVHREGLCIGVLVPIGESHRCGFVLVSPDHEGDPGTQDQDL